MDYRIWSNLWYILSCIISAWTVTCSWVVYTTCTSTSRQACASGLCHTSSLAQLDATAPLLSHLGCCSSWSLTTLWDQATAGAGASVSGTSPLASSTLSPSSDQPSSAAASCLTVSGPAQTAPMMAAHTLRVNFRCAAEIGCLFNKSITVSEY